MSKELKNKILDLYYKGYLVHEIARKLDITEYEVCKALGQG